MKIALCLGHSKLKNGKTTGAVGFCNEYNYNKKLIKEVAKELKRKGHKVTKIVCPEKKFTSASEEKYYKLQKIAKNRFDLIIELHLNSYTKEASGCEVLYKSDRGKRYAERINQGLSCVFKDRGTKKRDDLYMLNQTKDPAVIVESFFCTNEFDYKKAKGLRNRKTVAEKMCMFL